MNIFQSSQKTIDQLCDELKYSDYSIKEMLEKFKPSYFYFSRFEDLYNLKGVMTMIYDSIVEHVKLSSITGEDEFIALIKFYIRNLNLLETLDLDFLLRLFKVDHLPIKVPLDEELIFIFSRKSNLELFIDKRKDELYHIIESLDYNQFSEMMYNAMLPNNSKENFPDFNYTFINYIVENFPMHFDEFFLRYIRHYFNYINKKFTFLLADLEFIHLIKERYPVEFSNHFSTEFFEVLTRNYDRISKNELYIIFYFDLDEGKYVYKVHPNYKETFSYLYEKKGEVVKIFGFIMKSSNQQLTGINFFRLNSAVNQLRNGIVSISGIKRMFRPDTITYFDIFSFPDLE